MLESSGSSNNNNNSSSSSARKKKTVMMMMMMTKNKNKAGRVQQQQRGTAARVITHTGSGGGGGGAAAAAEGARLSKKKKKKKKKKKRQSGGAGGGGEGGARDDESKEEEKDEEPMETESEEEEKMEEEEEEEEGSTPVDSQAAKCEGQAGVTSQMHSPLSVSLEVKTSDIAQPEEKLQPLVSTSLSLSKLNLVRQEATSEGGMVNQVESIGTGSLREEQRLVTANHLQTNIQNQVVVVSDGVMIPSSIPIKTYSGCKTEVGVSSCLLTPSASPGAAEERGMNGGVFVKSESTVVNPADWTVADVASYFTAVGFPEQALAFRTQEIDGKSLLLMQRNDVLTGLSIRLGPALKIYERHVKVLQRTHFQDDEAFC